MMKASDINSVADCQRYVEGCLNDFEAGISTKDETIKNFKDYTFRLLEMVNKANKGAGIAVSQMNPVNIELKKGIKFDENF